KRRIREGITSYGERGEIAARLVWGKHSRAHRSERFARPRALVSEKEEGLVAATVDLRDPHGTAHGGAKLMALKRVLGRGEKAPCVEPSIPVEVKQRSMNIVGAGFGDHVHYPAANIAVLGGKVVGLDAELLNRIGIWKGIGDVDDSVGVGSAIEEKCRTI